MALFEGLFDFLFGSDRADQQYENNINLQKGLFDQHQKFMGLLGDQYGLGKGS